MKLIALQVDGFGKLAGRTFAFEPGLIVVYGPNEAGKSTLAAAIVATLYGVGRERDAWRPWLGAPYATRLTYALADGREFEVQREFERDPKSVRVYDRSGNDVTAETATGRTASPGLAHLGIPLEVFVNATCARQGTTRIDGSRAEAIGSSLARALDGGPREDAAIGAIGRLERALVAQADELRAALHSIAELRGRVESRSARAAQLADDLVEHARRGRNLRAAALRDRLQRVRDVRDHAAVLEARRGEYDDVAGFPRERVAELEARFARWQALESVAVNAAAQDVEARMTPALASELDERRPRCSRATSPPTRPPPPSPRAGSPTAVRRCSALRRQPPRCSPPRQWRSGSCTRGPLRSSRWWSRSRAERSPASAQGGAGRPAPRRRAVRPRRTPRRPPTAMPQRKSRAGSTRSASPRSTNWSAGATAMPN